MVEPLKKSILLGEPYDIIMNTVKGQILTLPREYTITEARTAAQVLLFMKVRKPQFAILELQYPDGNLLSLMPALLHMSPETSILIYSDKPEKLYARRLILLGAKGYLSKSGSLDNLKEAILTLITGEFFISPQLQKFFFAPRQPNQPVNPLYGLTDRELEILEYLTMGTSVRDISQILALENTTVNSYKRKIMDKMESGSVLELKDKYIQYRDI